MHRDKYTKDFLNLTLHKKLTISISHCRIHISTSAYSDKISLVDRNITTYYDK